MQVLGHKDCQVTTLLVCDLLPYIYIQYVSDVQSNPFEDGHKQLCTIQVTCALLIRTYNSRFYLSTYSFTVIHSPISAIIFGCWKSSYTSPLPFVSLW